MFLRKGDLSPQGKKVVCAETRRKNAFRKITSHGRTITRLNTNARKTPSNHQTFPKSTLLQTPQTNLLPNNATSPIKPASNQTRIISSFPEEISITVEVTAALGEYEEEGGVV
jgi:hypothetical protein